MRWVLVIDDDEVSREVVMLFAEEAGYEAVAAESGDAALAMLRQMLQMPFAVVADLQMPGIAGDALGCELRRMCGKETRLVAMSGAETGSWRKFDGFLRKPFSAGELQEALDGSLQGLGQDVEEDHSEVLRETIFQSLAGSMPGQQLRKLYGMCVEDAERKIEGMRRACWDGDTAGLRQAAHAIRGGCGIVGAAELALLAGELEDSGVADDRSLEALRRLDMALLGLRRVLDAQLGEKA